MFIIYETKFTASKEGFRAHISEVGTVHDNCIYFHTCIINCFISTIIDDKCQYWIDLKNMKLTSPNYPKWYIADGIGCGWKLTAPEGNKISLEFNHFMLSSHFEVCAN